MVRKSQSVKKAVNTAFQFEGRGRGERYRGEFRNLHQKGRGERSPWITLAMSRGGGGKKRGGRVVSETTLKKEWPFPRYGATGKGKGGPANSRSSKRKKEEMN